MSFADSAGGGGGGASGAATHLSVTSPLAAIVTAISPAASSDATHGTPLSVPRPVTTVPGSPFSPLAPAGPAGPGSPFSPFAPATFQLTVLSRRRHCVELVT